MHQRNQTPCFAIAPTTLTIHMFYVQFCLDSIFFLSFLYLVLVETKFDTLLSLRSDLLCIVVVSYARHTAWLLCAIWTVNRSIIDGIYIYNIAKGIFRFCECINEIVCLWSRFKTIKYEEEKIPFQTYDIRLNQLFTNVHTSFAHTVIRDSYSICANDCQWFFFSF